MLTPNTLIVGIIAALIGFLGTVLATHLQGRNALELERQKAESARFIQSQHFQSSLIIEAIKTGTQEKAAKNLIWVTYSLKSIERE